ncbi:MAG: GH39 family glycosyl hydrolase [Limisphaerales bacterium]
MSDVFFEKSLALLLFMLVLRSACCQEAPGAVSTGRETMEAVASGKDTISIDFGSALGKRIKALHGVNGGPFSQGAETDDLIAYHAEAGFPHTRLHDCRWPSPNVVDIPCVFPLFHAEVDDARNYVFAPTDDYLAPIVKNGSQIVYRLGTGIEHKTHYYVHPPKDFQKWAEIGVHLIRHYNEGWASGFHFDIRYWEIWNEPDLQGQMWTGTMEQYFALYQTAALAIKAHDPKLKVGGPAVMRVDSDWVRPFLKFCQARKLPLDFFSYHWYGSDPAGPAASAVAARKVLDEFGFQGTEIHLNEWHYLNAGWNELRPATREGFRNLRGKFQGTCGPEAAAFAAAVLIQLQDTPLDVANYFCAGADTLHWGMFDEYGVPSSTYWAFRAFNELTKTPVRVSITAPPSIYVCAGLSDDKQQAGLLLANHKTPQAQWTVSVRNVPLTGKVRLRQYLVDERHEFSLVRDEAPADPHSALHLTLPPCSVCYLRLSSEK